MPEIWPLHALVTVSLSLLGLGRERHSFGPSRLISRVRDAREMGQTVVVAHAGFGTESRPRVGGPWYPTVRLCSALDPLPSTQKMRYPGLNSATANALIDVRRSHCCSSRRTHPGGCRATPRRAARRNRPD